MCTWRTALVDFFTFKWLRREAQPAEGPNKPEQLKNIWKDTFNRLEAYAPEMPTEPLHEHQPEVINMAQQARAKKTGHDLPAHQSPASKTCNDLQAWFGESVATWDPNVNAQNVDSIDQQTKIRRATRWTKESHPR
ncbi:MAG: hypothetical protein IT343_10415 [Candidatus Melainabacteria bacterium]|jgi:hypothetical protein|nr:hypothetical protein [Candidatus Melainabacteria bacterium]